MRKNVVTTLCIVIGVLLVGLGVTAYIFWSGQNEPVWNEQGDTVQIADNGKFIEGIVVDGIEISGMTYDDALKIINREHLKQDEGFKLQLKLDDYSTQLEAPDIIFTYNTRDVLDEALQLGRRGSPSECIEEKRVIAEQGRSFATEKSYALDDIGPKLTDMSEKLYIEPQDAQVQFDISLPEKFTYTNEIPGRAVDTDALEKTILKRLEDNNFEPLIIPVTTIDPLITVDQLGKQNVMVSTYTTSFKKSPLGNANRVYNINRVAETINGVCVMPGEEFNINKILGPRTYELGWKGANGIRDGKYEIEPGGGVCQGSSTLYNAVMMADLEVTDRTPHSWPLSYIPIGRDATISTGGPNFCFRNNRNTPIFVVAYTDKTKKTITVEIWGEPLPDGMSIKIDSKKTGSLSRLGTKTEIDPSLGPGEQRVEREAKVGSIAETYKEYYDKDGNLIKRELYVKSTYRSIQGIVYVSAVSEDVAGQFVNASGGGDSVPALIQ